MVKSFKIILLAVFGGLLMQGAFANSSDLSLDKYPKAEEGMIRQVIILPKLADEETKKVELLIGKEMDVDCNHHFFGGELVERDLQGWGYTYLELAELKGSFSTLMACLDGNTTKKFITINNPNLYRYNSKLPIVVYVPEGVQVKYRVWAAGVETKEAVTK